MNYFFRMLFVSLFLIASPAYAELWESYRGTSEMFAVEFPGEPKKTYTKVRVSPEVILHYEEMTYDEEIPGTNAKKHYILRMDQTYSNVLRYIDQQRLQIDAIEERYKKHYESLGGHIKDSFVIEQHGYFGKEFW